jgi:hypothetical protein
MSASEEHATAVNTATSEAQTLAAEAERNLKESVETAAAGVAAAIDTLKSAVTALLAQAETSQTAAQNTLGPAEQHVSATQAAGQGTLGHVLAAQEACQLAVNAATGVQEFMGTLAGAVEEAQSVAITSLMSLLGQLDDGIEGAKTVVGHLEEATTQITIAQTPQ